MSRLSYPRAGEPRPAALPPDQRTVGQLVAEAIKVYQQRFWALVPLGLVLVGLDLAAYGRSVLVQTLLVWAFGPLLTAAFVRACEIAAGETASWRARLTAFAAGLVVFAPFPVLLRLYLVPGAVLFGLLGLAVPVALWEHRGIRSALRRGLELGRADAWHSIGGIATLGLVYLLTRYTLVILLHTQGNQTEKVAAVLSDLVLSPLVFVGAALLYTDQAARLEVRAR